MKSHSIVIFISLALLTGCHTYEVLSKDEYKDIKENDRLEIWSENAKFHEINKVKQSILSGDKLEIVDQNSERLTLLIKDINGIAVRKLDYH